MIGEFRRPAFAFTDRGYNVQCFYGSAQESLIVVTRDGVPHVQFRYPSYRIWNIAAHFNEMVDNWLERSEHQ